MLTSLYEKVAEIELGVGFNFTLQLKRISTHQDYESDTDTNNVIEKLAMLTSSVHHETLNSN